MTIPYTQLDLGAMFRRYNEEAEARNLPKMRQRPKDRGAMGKALALLMATPKPKAAKAEPKVSPRAKKNREIRAVVVEELCKIDYHEDRDTGARRTSGNGARSVGYSYTAVLAAVKERLPNAKMTGAKIRVHAANILNHKPGYETAKLPDRRPHSRKGKTNGQ